MKAGIPILVIKSLISALRKLASFASYFILLIFILVSSLSFSKEKCGEVLEGELQNSDALNRSTMDTNQKSTPTTFSYRATPLVVDLEKLEKWVLNHPAGEPREVATILASIIRSKSRISSEELEHNLFKIGARILDFFHNHKSKSQQEIIIVHKGHEKSARWIYQWMIEIGAWPEEMKVSKIIKDNQLNVTLERHPEGFFVYVDDASFSGEQIEHIYESFLKERDLRNFSQANILVAAPYMSKAAIRGLIQRGFNNFLYEEILPHVEDLIRQDASIQDPERIIGIMQKMYSMSSNGYLSYFDHILPDQASSMTDSSGVLTVLRAAPVVDADGKRLNSSRRDPSIGFLDENILPPYKAQRIPYKISE